MRLLRCVRARNPLVFAMGYRPNEIEPRWQQHWDANDTFVATEDRTRPKFYALDMFPYPSGKGLHIGHPAGYTASDVVSRYKRARGFNVLHPMGYDAFGLPAEQRAIDEGIAPQVSTAEAIENFRRQLKMLGFSYDWSREVSTADPAYYRWTQWIFTKLYAKNLAYVGEAWVNWCQALGTVLANDEVIDGKSERGNHPVERKKIRQWMIRITSYADKLLTGLDTIDWPEATKTKQREWIGRSEGAFVDFAIDGTDEKVTVFTTRPDTLWGATYMVLAPEHPAVASITAPERKAAVTDYQHYAAARSEKDRQANKQKTGVDTGARAVNPVNGAKIPVWIADYVIASYGTGAIMAVPGHDERDWEFAKAMKLPIVEVISGGNVAEAAHTGEGAMVNSGPFDGTPTANREAVRKVINWLEARALGNGATTWKMRDWAFARQRYWGEPIPVLKRGPEVARALRDDELPLELPVVSDYAPSGTGESPLARAKDWARVRDEETGEELSREVDTMPGSAGSSWYFLRYCDPRNDRELCAREKSDYWMPVDLYVGGSEHAVGHLMYSRMWQRFLCEEGFVRDAEPFAKLRHQGMILGETFYVPEEFKAHGDEARNVPRKDKEGVPLIEERDGKYYRKSDGVELLKRVEKMSKRKGNVINPDEVIRDHGADALRVYICFMGPLETDKPWQTQGIEGQSNWLKRAWRLFFEGDEDLARVDASAAAEAELRIIHKAIKKVTRDIESLDLNTAISALHVATRDLTALNTRSRAVLEPLAQLIAPFAPHFAEEAWTRGLGHPATPQGISYVPWPAWDDRYAVDDTVTIGVQVNGKTQGTIQLAPDADEATAVESAKQAVGVQRHLEGKSITKVIYKAGRILNLIVK
jgi:leucyl-tRNA synthetase